MSTAEPDGDDLAERLLDLVVYAPLGLALEAKDLLPKLAERGRGQIALTRLAGTVAARQGQHEAEKLVDEIRSSIGAFLGLDDHAADVDEPDEGEDDLPIADYATMTAVDIIPLLGGLDPAELDAIEAFERAHRARTTVLNRIAQRRNG
ncbi:MAG: hypothetical protein AAGA90_10225 [Actinomycetota bacterium]